MRALLWVGSTFCCCIMFYFIYLVHSAVASYFFVEPCSFRFKMWYPNCSTMCPVFVSPWCPNCFNIQFLSVSYLWFSPTCAPTVSYSLWAFVLWFLMQHQQVKSQNLGSQERWWAGSIQSLKRIRGLVKEHKFSAGIQEACCCTPSTLRTQLCWCRWIHWEVRW